MVTTPRARAGFTLVEVAIALVLLAVGALAAATAGGWAAAHLRAAESEARATAMAAALVDSLVALDAVAAGTRTAGDVTLSWGVERDSAGVLRVRVGARYAVGADRRTVSLEVVGAVIPPRLEADP